MKRDKIIEKIEKAILEGAKKGLKEAADYVEVSAKINAPVDTGKLRDSIESVQVSDFHCKVKTDVVYAYYQHETNKNGGLHYLSRALYEHPNTLTAIVSNSVQEELKKL
jgi:hypothetical protein